MPFEIVRNDITKIKVDAIINTANPSPEYGSGTDYAVYMAAGADELLEARKAIGHLAPGESAITPGFNLPAKHIIHTVGSSYIDGKSGEEDILRSCYRSAFELAKQNNIKSLATPLLASGNYGYPKGIAFRIAVEEIRDFLDDTDMDIYLLVFDKKTFDLSTELYGSVESYINEQYVENAIVLENDMCSDAEFAEPVSRRRTRPSVKDRFLNRPEASECMFLQTIGESSPKAPKARSFEDLLKSMDKSFMDRVYEYADMRGMSDSQVTNRANLDRRTLSKLRCGKTKAPSKNTALAIAIALRLSLDETKDLLASAGLAISHCEKFDLIVEYFIVNKDYNIDTINAVLFDYNLPLLGQAQPKE